MTDLGGTRRRKIGLVEGQPIHLHAAATGRHPGPRAGHSVGFMGTEKSIADVVIIGAGPAGMAAASSA
jgi:NADPH-dependent 2,4-dienoyl-CoA reductase/sulfur reductase-like enzyme